MRGQELLWLTHGSKIIDRERFTLAGASVPAQATAMEVLLAQMVKQILKVAFDCLVALAAIVCILAYLNVKPQDLKTMVIPHSVWLLLALLLFALSISSSVYSFIRQMRQGQSYRSETNTLKAQLKDLNEKITTNDQAYASRTADLTRVYTAQVAEQKQHTDENFKKWNDEVQAHQETKTRERDAKTYRAQAEEALAAQKRDHASNNEILHKEIDNQIQRANDALAKLEKAQRANVPSLLIEYRIERQLEYLEFINDGIPTIKEITVGPIRWDTAYRREINLHNVLGPLQSKHRIDSRFAVFEQIGKSQDMLKLPDMLREMIRRGCQADAKVTVCYTACDSRFSQRYTLNIDPFNRIVWNPDPVNREPDASEAQ